MRIFTSAEQLIGRTPMLELKNIEKEEGVRARLFAKLEYANPGGSVKDRVALNMLDDAEARGLIKPGAVIIEPTSGNTGVGLALIGALRGYRVIIVMPDTMSVERQKAIRAYGAEVVLTPGSGGMTAAIERAERIAAETPGSFIPSQFENPANPQAHIIGTGPEIWDDMDGDIDVFIAGVGTGGTLTGVGEVLKAYNDRIRIVAVEPAGSPVLSGGEKGPHGLMGIGAGFVPSILNRDIISETITV
ncbi:MAG: cysteine synthase family protein, partial [Clostridia bacterium]|nr:cysteine synthase family protein [Clostridia bacterium]